MRYHCCISKKYQSECTKTLPQVRVSEEMSYSIYLFIFYLSFLSHNEILCSFKKSAQTPYCIYNVCVGRNNAFSATTYLWTIWAIMTHNWKSSICKGGIKWPTNSSKCKECAEHVIEDLLLTIFLLKKTNYWTLCIILCLWKRANICHAAIIFLVRFLFLAGKPP